jgi:predicted kinase
VRVGVAVADEPSQPAPLQLASRHRGADGGGHGGGEPGGEDDTDQGDPPARRLAGRQLVGRQPDADVHEGKPGAGPRRRRLVVVLGAAAGGAHRRERHGDGGRRQRPTDETAPGRGQPGRGDPGADECDVEPGLAERAQVWTPVGADRSAGHPPTVEAGVQRAGPLPHHTSDGVWNLALRKRVVMRQPTLFLTVGLPCAGKTTAARRIEAEHKALRLTKDEWVKALYGQENPPTAGDVIEGRLIQIGLRALELGNNVVIDYGLWSRDERSALRQAAADRGAAVTMLYFEVSLAEQRSRRDQRQAEAPATTWLMSDDELIDWAATFEVPGQGELDGTEPVDPPPAGFATWDDWREHRWPPSVH